MVAIAGLGLPFLGSAQTAEPVFEFKLTDPAGDQSEECVNGLTPSPCDILSFEATSTDTDFFFRFTTSTLTFPATATTSSVHFQFTFKDPGGTTYMAQRSVTASGQGAASFGGNPPQPPGLTWTLDRPKATFTGQIPLAGLAGVAPGATLVISLVSTGWTHAGVLYYLGEDVISPLENYVFPVSIVPEALTLEQPVDVAALPGSNATIGMMVQNQMSSPADVSFNATAEGTGLAFTFTPPNATVPGDGTLPFNLTIDIAGDVAEGVYPINVSVTGPNGGTNFTVFNLIVSNEASPPNATGEPGPTETADATSDTGTTDGTGGANATGNGTAAAGEEAGGIPSPSATLAGLAVVAALAIVFARRRKVE